VIDVKKFTVTLSTALCALVVPGPFGERIGPANAAVAQATASVRNWRFTEAEDRGLGADVSARLRDRYGVVQDAAVHKYVTLLGSAVAGNSSLSHLRWTFVVLDTDEVQAFAAPGGFVHITRGALAMIQSESELAGLIAHEIGHLMARHTIRMVQNAKADTALTTAATRPAFLEAVGRRLYAVTLASAFGRTEEMEADKIAVALANDAGYSPAGLAEFLNHLAERNKDVKERRGLFASHSETTARRSEVTRMIKLYQLTNTAAGRARYEASIPYKPSAAAAPQARKGGQGNALVPVTVTADEIAAFRKGIV
jgi:predicted Zn-dependent protease